MFSNVLWDIASYVAGTDAAPERRDTCTGKVFIVYSLVLHLV